MTSSYGGYYRPGAPNSVYAEEMRSVARVQAFRDFLVVKAQRWTY